MYNSLLSGGLDSHSVPTNTFRIPKNHSSALPIGQNTITLVTVFLLTISPTQKSPDYIAPAKWYSPEFAVKGNCRE